MTSENDLRDALARELYWAEEATPRSRMDTGEVRDALHDFAASMRDDEKQIVPRGEPNLRKGTIGRRFDGRNRVGCPRELTGRSMHRKTACCGLAQEPDGVTMQSYPSKALAYRRTRGSVSWR